jgi:hypothetical protein
MRLEGMSISPYTVDTYALLTKCKRGRLLLNHVVQKF